MRWRRQKSRILVCFNKLIDSVTAVPGAHCAPRNTLIHVPLFHVVLLLFFTLLCFWKVMKLCVLCENLFSSSWCPLCPQEHSYSWCIVSCCTFIVLHIIMFLKVNKVMRSLSENLFTCDICQGLRLSRVLCCGKVCPIRREILGISYISQGFTSSMMWCIDNALHPVRHNL